MKEALTISSRQALHNLLMLRVSQKQCVSLEEFEIVEVETWCNGAGNQGEAVIFQYGAAKNGFFGDPEKRLLAF